jgi:DNA repair protein RadC
MDNYKRNTSIKLWAEDDRPREKLMLKGKHTLSNAELLAILISTGIKDQSALDLAKAILKETNNNLIELSKLSVHELIKFPGIGTAKAITIIAALEIGLRRRSAGVLHKEKISSSKDVFEIFYSVLADTKYEQFWLLLLNRANRVLRKINISEGGLSGTVADPKKIFITALEYHASSIILCHNHPSGNLKPSDSDIRLTNKLKQAGLMLDMPVLDHVIIGDESYFSFADEGKL